MTEIKELRRKGRWLQRRASSANGNGSRKDGRPRPEYADPVYGRFGDSGLTDRQYAFVLEYVLDPSSATAAAKRAGFAPKSAAQHANYMLKQDHIVAVINELRDRLLDNHERLIEQMVDRLRDIAMDKRGIPRASDSIQAIEKWLKYHGIDLQTSDTSSGRVEIVISHEDSPAIAYEDAEWEDVDDA